MLRHPLLPCLAICTLLLPGCLFEEATPLATAVPVQPTVSRPPLLSPVPIPQAIVSPVPSPSPTASARTYTVEEGDSLSSIAARFYGDADQWRVLYEANRDQLTSPDELRVGQTLRIPALPRS